MLETFEENELPFVMITLCPEGVKSVYNFAARVEVSDIIDKLENILSSLRSEDFQNQVFLSPDFDAQDLQPFGESPFKRK